MIRMNDICIIVFFIYLGVHHVFHSSKTLRYSTYYSFVERVCDLSFFLNNSSIERQKRFHIRNGKHMLIIVFDVTTTI